MWNIALSIIFGIALLLPAQKPRMGSAAVKRGSVPAMDKGSVEGRTYTNPSIGLELTPATGLVFDTPELTGTPGSVPELVTIAAWGEKRWFAVRNGTVFYADALAYYPESQRSTESYLRKVIRGNVQEGFEPVQQKVTATLGGVSFARTDFKKGAVYEVVLVKACDAQAFVFIFTGSGPDAVNGLIKQTGLKLDPLRSGCHLAATAK